jgi:hypothetical protein
VSPVVLPPSVAHNWRQRVLVLPGWPHGWCPEHVFTEHMCHEACVPARVAFAEAARELWDYWPIWEHYRRRAAA